MSVEQNKEIVRRFNYELLNEYRLEVADEIFAPDARFYADDLSLLAKGPEGVKELFTRIHSSFPDRRVSIEDLFGEGDRVACRFIQTATHQVEVYGVPPTGKKLTWTGIDIFRIADGKIQELWPNIDSLRMMEDLGVVPKGRQPGR